MVFDGQHPSLLVEVGDRGSARAAGCCTKCRALDSLKSFDVGWGGVGEPNRSGVVEDGADEEFVSGGDCFHLLAPSGTTQGFKDIYSGASSFAEVVCVAVEGEEGIERHPQDPGVLF